MAQFMPLAERCKAVTLSLLPSISYNNIQLVFIPLLLGALAMAVIVRYGCCAEVHYHDDNGHLHELIDIEGDGLERAIALYDASEPSFEQALQGMEGT